MNLSPMDKAMNEMFEPRDVDVDDLLDVLRRINETLDREGAHWTPATFGAIDNMVKETLGLPTRN